MAATATERKLLLDGEWVETGQWIDVASPYDGSVVARVAKAGAAEARAAVDAAERAMRKPLPAHKRAEILVRVAGALGSGRTRWRGSSRQRRESRSRPPASRSHARCPRTRWRRWRRASSPVRWCRWTRRRRARASWPSRCASRSGSSARSAPSTSPQPRRAQDRAGAGRRLRRRAQAGLPDPAVRAAPRRARARRRPAARLAERPRRPLGRDRGRARGGRARRADHVHWIRVGRLGHPRASAEGSASTSSSATRRPSSSSPTPTSTTPPRGARPTRSRSPGRAASPSSESSSTTRSTTPSGTRSSRASRRSGSVTPRTRRRTSAHSSARPSGTACWTGSRRPAPPRDDPHGRDPRGRADRPHRRRAPGGGHAPRVRRGVRTGLHAPALHHAGRGDRARERDALRPASRDLHVQPPGRARRRALEFGGVTVNEVPTFRADQMPYGGVKDSGNTREGPAWAVREMTEERLVVVQL